MSVYDQVRALDPEVYNKVIEYSHIYLSPVFAKDPGLAIEKMLMVFAFELIQKYKDQQHPIVEALEEQERGTVMSKYMSVAEADAARQAIRQAIETAKSMVGALVEVGTYHHRASQIRT